MTSERPLADELVTHAGFLRALARGLLTDEHAADDVVQQAFLRALARPPESRGFLRAWLGRVVRHLALNRVRDDERRHARERAAARPELERSSERAALELTLQREVAAALAELDEPYRTTLHLRYFRGLTPTAIAQELGLPPKTVETRLTRAHARLRTRLARAWSEQDEHTRAFYLATLTGAGPVVTGVLMTKQIVLVGVGGALLVGLLLTWRALDGAGARAEAPTVVETPLTPPSEPLASVVEDGEREPVSSESERVADELELSSPTDPDAELRASLDRLALVLDRSLEGRLDPGAILDAALLVAAHEIGTPLAELQLNGALAIPIEGLPEGISAELNVGSPLKGQSLTLLIRLPRNAPFAHGGYERAGSEVRVLVTPGSDGEPRSLAYLTSTDLTDAAQERADRSGSFEFTSGASFSQSLGGSSAWKLQTVGSLGYPIPNGLEQRIVYADPPQILEGGPWPRADDIRRLAQRLRELHELAKAGAGR